MTDQEVALKLNSLEHEVKSLKHRASEHEDKSETTQTLILSVQELAINMKNMLEEQKEQGIRIAKLEREPANRLTQIKTAIITALTTALISGAISAILLFR